MNNLLILLICHIVSDFYMQSDFIAKSKKNLNKSMIKHFIIYSIPYVLVLCKVKEGFAYFLVITISHLIIDICSVYFKNKHQEKECIIFTVDQILHILVICFCSLHIFIKEIIPLNILILILAILILIKPISIFISLFFKTIFKNTRIEEKEEENEDKNEVRIGRYIGYLERIIIFLLCSFNSISAIGFVIAAKTLVRYKDINDVDGFQEKYLIGTLLSTIGALCCFALAKFAGLN